MDCGHPLNLKCIKLNEIITFLDNDDDGDGIPDNEEIIAEVDHSSVQSKSPDSDGDGIPDHLDTDDEGDGIPDEDETIGGIGMRTHILPPVFCQCLVNSFPCPFLRA